MSGINMKIKNGEKNGKENGKNGTVGTNNKNESNSNNGPKKNGPKSGSKEKDLDVRVKSSVSSGGVDLNI